jgi:hypothetical protein
MGESLASRPVQLRSTESSISSREECQMSPQSLMYKYLHKMMELTVNLVIMGSRNNAFTVGFLEKASAPNSQDRL